VSDNAANAVMRHRTLIGLIAIILAAATWYLWPLLSATHGDVAWIGDSGLQPAGDDLRVEVRDKGRNIVALGQVSDWCALAASLPSIKLPAHVGFVVIGLAEVGPCSGDPVGIALGELRRKGVAPVLVVYPGRSAVASGVRLVTSETLLGPPGTTARPCQWWDDCPSSGSIDVRLADGSLNAAGFNRIARMVAATIG
jgi:hypothetical protein